MRFALPKPDNFISVLIVTVCLQSNAIAASWINYAESGAIESGNYSIHMIDSETVKRNSSGIFTVWEKIDYSKNKTQKARSRVARFELNCNSSEYRITDSIYYTKSGSILESNSYDDSISEWMEAAPDSVGAAMISAVCR